MKKLFLSLTILLVFFVTYGQGTNVIHTSHHPISTTSGSSTYTDEYQALLDKWTTDPTGDTLTWQNDMLYSLDTAGYLDRMDKLGVLANVTNGDNEALVDWTDTSETATAVNSPTFTRNMGFKSNGTTSYINTNWNPTDDGDNYSLNDGTIGFYYLSHTNSSSSRALGGINDGDNDLYIYYNDEDLLAKINSATAINPSITDPLGLNIFTRRSSTDQEFYIDDSYTRAWTYVSTALPDYDFYVLALNNEGTASTFLDEDIGIFFIMDGITDDEEDDLYTIFYTYLDNIGAL